MARVVLSCDSAGVVVVAEAFSLPYLPLGHQQNQGLPPAQQFHGFDIALAAILAHAVDEPRHVGESFRADDECLVGVFTSLQLHQAIVLALTLQLDALPQGDHFSHVFANQRFFRNGLIRNHVIALSFHLLEDVRSNR